jgi:hypothetical protein
MTMCGPEIFGANPVKIKWNVVRGDSASLRVEFLENDEQTRFSTSEWTYKANAYDPKGDTIDELEVVSHNGYVDIKATPEITQYWGTGYTTQVAELTFDLEVIIDEVTWTPVIGTIIVYGDISGSL